LSPGAWPVDEPSKFHSGRSLTDSTFFFRVYKSQMLANANTIVSQLCVILPLAANSSTVAVCDGPREARRNSREAPKRASSCYRSWVCTQVRRATFWKCRMCLTGMSHEGIVLVRGLLTLHFERVPPLASIQTYSAMTEPRWSRLRYFWSCALSVRRIASRTRSAMAYVSSVGHVDAFVGLEKWC
jgi:hypothetical protein